MMHYDYLVVGAGLYGATFANLAMLMRYKAQILPAQLNLLDSHDVSRFLSLCHGDIRRYQLAILFMMSFVGMPTVFYGDELGIMGDLEWEYRRPMPWQGGSAELHGFFKRAIAMRQELKALRRGKFRMLQAREGSQLLVFARKRSSQTVTVCINAGERPEDLPKVGGALYWAENLRDNVLGGFGFGVFVDGSGDNLV